MSTQENDEETAAHACSACKRQKRKCDKRLPRCSLCERTTRDCDYSDQSFSSLDTVAVLQNRVTELEALLAEKINPQQDNTSLQVPKRLPTAPNYDPSARLIYTNPFDVFPAVFFLDNEVFRDVRMTIPKFSPPIPNEIYSMLGNIDGLRNIAMTFFSNIHPWLPILSRKRFELILSTSNFELPADLALLFATMNLLTDINLNCLAAVRSNSYWAIKNFTVFLEANSVMTPHFLQANVLIAMYEIAHAIYPSAYLSVGKCATLGKAYGLDDRKHAPQMLRKFGAWAENEEVRRLWWAILLLDRYIHLGIPGHALTTPEPRENDILPANDAQFDEADMAGNEPLYIASPTAIRAGPFTRTCQAAHLVGKVVNLLNDFFREAPTRFIMGLQTYRILTAFVEIVQQDFNRSPEQYATPLALTYSGIIHLCDTFCCIDRNRGAHTAEEAELQELCIVGMKKVSDDMAKFALRMRPSMTINHGAISPLLGNCFYMGVATLAWRVYEGEHSVLEGYRLLRNALSSLNGRWAVGGEYLRAFDRSKELLYDSALL